MVIDEKNCEETINAFTAQDWQPLLDLIPEIEKSTRFAEFKRGERNKEGVIQMPYYEPASVVSRFLEIVYDIPIMISFDWGSWDDGERMVNDEKFDFDTIDLVTKCKVVTALVRNDRYCEGTLVSAFESGLILEILRSIEREISAG